MSSPAGSSNFEDLRRDCLERGILYEDPDFPATGPSIYTDYYGPDDDLWKRPKDIVADPHLLVDGAQRFDLVQGSLGDCWFIASAAVIATKPKLFKRVVPPDQSFHDKYAGIFHFFFWRFGKWTEVIIDDRLPVTPEGQLRFGCNKVQSNEFWGPLLEKAFAKLHGSYDRIDCGHICNALVDMSGGLSESYPLRRTDRLPPNFWEVFIKSYDMGSLMGCSIIGDNESFMEEEMWNGLYKGHAYSITCVLETRIQSWPVKLLRIRNPWGEGEWTGAWSDKSEEWKNVSDEEKKDVGMVCSEDGEFWMSFDDWMTNFHNVEIVHLGPEEFTQIDKEVVMKWHEQSFHGKWVKGVNAGGCGLLGPDREIYYTNPQYYFVLETPDIDDVSQECTVVISLMQKQYRKRRADPKTKSLIIGFDVHLIKSPDPMRLETHNIEKASLKRQFKTRSPLREVTDRLSLDPGHYCIIPNTLKCDQEGEFLLRVYTYAKIKAGPLDQTSSEIPEPNPMSRPVGTVPSELFWNYAGECHVIDARDLRDLICEISKKEFGETATFSIEACRSLIAMSDRYQTGVLDFEEMCRLWDEILFWRKIFKKYDKDQAGCIETYQLKNILKEIGVVLSMDTISALATRYGGKDRTLFFEDFALCLARTMSLFTAFKEYSQSSPGEARLNLDQWLITTIFL